MDFAPFVEGDLPRIYAFTDYSENPALKQRYEEMALKFVQNAGSEDDTDNTAPLPVKLDSGKTNPHERY